MKTTTIGFFIIILSFILPGCTAYRTAARGGAKTVVDYAIVLAPISGVAVSQAMVSRDENELVISGRIKRSHEVQLPGHVDLMVCAADGEALVRKKIPVPGLASKRRGIYELPFRSRLAFIPPEGAKIHLRYHAPSSASAGSVFSEICRT